MAFEFSEPLADLLTHIYKLSKLTFEYKGLKDDNIQYIHTNVCPISRQLSCSH